MAHKITVDEIIKLRTEREGYYEKLHKQQKEDNKLYELAFDAKIPKKLGYRQITPPTARDWVDIGVNHFTLDNPKSYVPPTKDSDAARAQAGKLENFDNFWLKQLTRQIKENARKLLARGECFWKTILDDTYYAVDSSKLPEDEASALEASKLLHFPLIVTTPDPINVLASPIEHDYIPEDVIEYYGRMVAEVRELCRRNGWKWDTNKKSTDTVMWTSYYSDKWRCFLVDNEALLKGGVQGNYLKLCPYVHVPAGYGLESYEGKPEYTYRSVLYRVTDMIKAEARGLSQHDAIAARYAWPWPKLSGDMDKAKAFYGGEMPTFSPDEVAQVPDGVELELIQGQQAPPGLFEHATRIGMRAQPPPIMSGYNPTGVHSGVHAEDLVATAKPHYKDAFKYHEIGLAKVLGVGKRLLETVFKDTVTVRTFGVGDEGHSTNYETLKPEDINGHYYCEVTLLADPPEALDVRKTLGANLHRSGDISLRTSLIQYQDMTGDEADDEMAEMRAEKLLDHPAMLEMMGLDAMKRLGMEQTEDLIRQKAKQQAGSEQESGTKSVPRLKRRIPGMERAETPRGMEAAEIPMEP